jgi:hypothetical protein
LTRPSRKRQLLAIYIDFLVFRAVYQPVAWTIRSTVPVDSWLVTLTVFAVLRGVAWALRLMLPGQWALGTSPGDDATVKPHVLERERWWTVAAGTLLVLEGSKNLVRWTQGLPVEPLLGPAAPSWMAITAITILGGLNVVAGLMVLRTKAVGAMIGIGVLCVEALAAMIHKDDFREWAGQAVVARRALQGLPVREGEVEMMQTMTATILPTVMVVGILWLLAIAVQFRGNEQV